MRAAAEREFGVRAKIKIGGRGEMTVLVNGRNVFSYQTEGSMPETGELLCRVAAARTGSTT